MDSFKRAKTEEDEDPPKSKEIESCSSKPSSLDLSLTEQPFQTPRTIYHSDRSCDERTGEEHQHGKGGSETEGSDSKNPVERAHTTASSTSIDSVYAGRLGRPCSPTNEHPVLTGNGQGKDLPQSQYRGVSWDRRMDMWRVKVNAVHIGFFRDEREAGQAYDRGKIAVFKGGSVLELNFPDLARDLPFRDVQLRRALVKSDKLVVHDRLLGDGKDSKSPRPSRYRGVVWDSGTKSWRAKIKIKTRTWYLGVFEDEMQAAKAYDMAATYVGRDKVKLNFPATDYSQTDLSRPAPLWVMEHIADLQTTLRHSNESETIPLPSTIAKAERLEMRTRSTSTSDFSKSAPKPTTLEAISKMSPARMQPRSLKLLGSDMAAAPSSGFSKKTMVEAAAATPGSNPLNRTLDAVVAANNQEQNAQGYYTPLRMRGVVAEAGGSHFTARLTYLEHSIYLGRYETALKACHAHDVACLRLLGAQVCQEKDLLNCGPSLVPVLLSARLPATLDFLASAFYQAAPNNEELVGDQACANISRFKARENKKQLQGIRKEYRRSKGGRQSAKYLSTTRFKDSFDGDAEGGDINETEEVDLEDDEYYGSSSLVEQVRQLEAKMRRIYSTTDIPATTRISPTLAKNGSIGVVERKLGKVPLAELAKRAVLEAAKRRLGG